jgi:large subunit ribosomal protein L21
MKYAIVASGGKQYRAVEGETIDVDLMQIAIGETVELNDVLLVSDDGNVSIGTPTLAGASIKATVADQIKSPKIIVFKYKADNNYRRKQGHRQKYTRLQVDEIVTG